MQLARIFQKPQQLPPNMESVRETLSRHTKIVGLKWTKLEAPTKKRDRESPVTRSATRSNENSARGAQKQAGNQKTKRVHSVRHAFGSLRQKLRVSTRRKKRLVNVDSPLSTMTNRTPASQRRPAHKNLQHDVKMYSPFTIDTPGTRTTPRAIRMGIQRPKRFNFSSSPGQVTREVNALAEGIKALSSNSSQLNQAIDGATPASEKMITNRTLPLSVTPARQSSPQQTTPVFI